jgi:DNA-binding phage protein
MRKKKTSKKQEFSLEELEPIKTAGGRLAKHSPSEFLKNKAMVFEALMESLKAGDTATFKEILAAHLDVLNKESFSKKAHIPKRTLFRMLAPDGNPTLDNVAKVVHALGF